MAVRLPMSTKVPSSISTVIHNINAVLKKDKYEGLIREILIGLHHYITIIFDRSVEGEICQVTLNYILGKFNTKRDDAHLLE